MIFKSSLIMITGSMALLLVSLSAVAQSSQLHPFPLDKPANSVKISVSYQFFLEGKAISVADQTSLANRGRRQIYMLLAKECEVILETIASQCSMDRANVNTQLRQGQRSRGREGVRVSGSSTYRITLKPVNIK